MRFGSSIVHLIIHSDNMTLLLLLSDRGVLLLILLRLNIVAKVLVVLYQVVRGRLRSLQLWRHEGVLVLQGNHLIDHHIFYFAPIGLPLAAFFNLLCLLFEP